MMRVTLEIVAQCLYGAEVTDTAERVGKAMEVVTAGVIKNASMAMLFFFDIPVPFARRGWRANRGFNWILGGLIQKRRSFKQRGEDLLELLLYARGSARKPH